MNRELINSTKLDSNVAREEESYLVETFIEAIRGTHLPDPGTDFSWWGPAGEERLTIAGVEIAASDDLTPVFSLVVKVRKLGEEETEDWSVKEVVDAVKRSQMNNDGEENVRTDPDHSRL